MKTKLPRIMSVRVLREHEVLLQFSDGRERRVDLDPLMQGPIFSEIRNDPVLFKEISVDEVLGTVVWPNGADLDPDVLYGSASPAWAPKRPAG